MADEFTKFTGFMRKPWLKILYVLTAYTSLALILTWPLPLHFTTHVPGDGGDDPALTWNLWWVKYALLDLRSSPFHCRHLFYPIGINLAFYTLTVLNGLLSIPLQFTFGLIPASNIVLLSSFVLSAFGAYLLARSLNGSRSELAPFLAGLIYGYASCKFFYAALGQFNIASSQWMPFFTLAMLKLGRKGGAKWAAIGAFFLLFQAWAEMTFASFLLILVVFYIIYALTFRFRPPLSLLAHTALMLSIFALGITPFLLAMVPDLLAEGDFFLRGTGFAEVFSADPIGLFLPTRLHPLLGEIVDRFPFPHDKGQHLYPGFTVVLLALAGLRKREARFWIASAVLFTILSFGPVLYFNGKNTGIPMPFALLQEVPFFKANRYPGRYNTMVMLCLSAAASLGAESFFGRSGSKTRRVLLVIFVLLVLFEHLSIPLPLSDMRIPEAYRIIASDPEPGTVMEIPLAWRNSFRITGTMHPVIMFIQYYQTFHQRPILGGNTSRNPEFKFQYFTEAPIINTIIALENGHTIWPEILEEDKKLAPYFLHFFNIRYIVIHPRQTPSALLDYLAQVFGLEIPPAPAEEPLIFKIEVPPYPDRISLKMEEPVAHFSRGEGWAPVPTGNYVWVQRRKARFFLTLKAGSYWVKLKVFSPGDGQEMALEIGERRLATFALKAGWQECEAFIPPGILKEGLNEFTLRFSKLFPSPNGILVRSAGMDVGDFVHIYVRGKDVAPDGRGYNLALVSPEGEVMGTVFFDTFASEEESERLANYLAYIPDGFTVIMGVRDEASLRLSDRAVKALQALGAKVDLRGCFRCSHAFIGIKGQGAIREAYHPFKPVGIYVGEATSEPTVAAAVAEVEFIPSEP